MAIPFIYLIPISRLQQLDKSYGIGQRSKDEIGIYSIRVLTKIILRAVQGKAVTNKNTTKIIIFMQCHLFSANFKAETINETYLGMFRHELYKYPIP